MRRTGLSPVPGLFFSLVLAALAPAQAASQAAVLDEGSFTLFLDGSDAGTERFTIQRQGVGDDARILATAEIEIRRDGETTQMRPVLQATPALAPSAYNNDMTGASTAKVAGFLQGNRFVSRTTSQEGESQKEFRAGPGTVILERDVAFLYYFVSKLAEKPGADLMVIEPLSGAQYRLKVASAEVEPFRLGREQLQVRHVRLEGGDRLHEVWLDDQGRVLRVEIPSRGYRAERTPN